MFLQNAKTSQFVWNSAPIDNTDFVRSLAAVGREFRFPLDVELSFIPPIKDVSNSALTKYLRDVSIESTFSVSIVNVLIEERQLAQYSCVTNTMLDQAAAIWGNIKLYIV